VRRSNTLITIAAGLAVLAAGLVAAVITFGVCNENAESRICDVAYTGSINPLIGIVPALIVVAAGLLLGRAALIATAAASLLLQAALALAVVIGGP
jgi:hypothetical protein